MRFASHRPWCGATTGRRRQGAAWPHPGSGPGERSRDAIRGLRAYRRHSGSPPRPAAQLRATRLLPERRSMLPAPSRRASRRKGCRTAVRRSGRVVDDGTPADNSLLRPTVNPLPKFGASGEPASCEIQTPQLKCWNSDTRREICTCPRSSARGSGGVQSSRETRRRRSALAITLTDDSDIAAAASTGEGSTPNHG